MTSERQPLLELSARSAGLRLVQKTRRFSFFGVCILEFLAVQKTILPGNRWPLAWSKRSPAPQGESITDAISNVQTLHRPCFKSLEIAVSADWRAGD